MTEGIVKADNTAASFLGFCEVQRAHFSEVSTFSEMHEEVRKIGNAKKLLEVADVYHKVAGEYCALEAEAMFRLSELDMDRSDTVGIKEGRLIDFLRKHKDDKRKFIDACKGRAVSIYTIKKEQDAVERMLGERRSIHGTVDKKLDEYKRTGRVKIGTAELMDGLNSDDLNRRTADGANERLRDKLLGMGAVGIGGNVYVTPSKENAEKALIIRLDSIKADIAALANLIKLTGYKDYTRRMLTDAINSLMETVGSDAA